MSKNIHATAIVGSSAVVDSSVIIGPYCVITGNVKIKKGCILHSHVCISGDTEIGENCEIFPFASIGSKPQDYKFKNEQTKLIIGNNNTIREYVTINPGTSFGGGVTQVGDNNLLMISSHIGHDAKIGSNCTIANNVPIAGHVVIEDFVTIGGNSAVHQFVRVGSNSMIGGMVGLKENVLPFSLVTPSHSSVYGAIRGVNIVGLKKRNFEKSDIQAIVYAFAILQQDGAIENKCQKLDTSNKFVKKIADFIKLSDDMEHSKGLAHFVKES